MGSLLGDLRRDPRHGPEIALLYTFQALRPRLERNWAARHAEHALACGGPEVAAGAQPPLTIPRRAISRARRGGAMTGTSFLVATPIGLLSIWLHQLTMVLEIATQAGLDPSSPQRLAEYLVLSKMHPSIDEATSVLTSIPSRGEKVRGQGIVAALSALAAQIPLLLGVTSRRVRSMGMCQFATLVATGVGCVFPVVGVPVFAHGSAKEARLLGERAVAFYASAAEDLIAQPAPHGLSERFDASPPPNARRAVAAVTVAFVAAVGLATWVGLARRHSVRVDVALGALWVWALASYVNVWVTLRNAGRSFR